MAREGAGADGVEGREAGIDMGGSGGAGGGHGVKVGDNGGLGGGEGGGEEKCLRLIRCEVEGEANECCKLATMREAATTASTGAARVGGAVRAAVTGESVVMVGETEGMEAAVVAESGGAEGATTAAVTAEAGGGSGRGWQIWQKDCRRDEAEGLQSMVEMMAA